MFDFLHRKPTVLVIDDTPENLTLMYQLHLKMIIR